MLVVIGNIYTASELQRLSERAENWPELLIYDQSGLLRREGIQVDQHSFSCRRGVTLQYMSVSATMGTLYGGGPD